MTGYERCLALPSMQQWLGAPMPPPDAFNDDDTAWEAAREKSPAALVSAFRQTRRQQIELLDSLAGLDWSAPRATLFGEKPLVWVVTKTFQHTYEHGDTLLRMGLWWEHILGEIAKYQGV